MSRIEVEDMIERSNDRKPLIGKSLHKEYGDRVVLDDISISINPGDKIGLVGLNGSGKTTLLRILGRLDKPDSGQVSNTGVRVGYLAQDYSLDSESTIWEVATFGVTEITEALDKFEAMNREFQADSLEFTKEYERILSLLDTHGAYGLEDRVKRILEGLGLDYPLETKAGKISGGETVKLSLAQLLVSQPDVLLLDEPTNHLDIHANLWLRDYVEQWQGGLVVVSHDRDFLNDITTSTWEIEDGDLRVFGGNYQLYKKQKGIEAEAREREIVRLESKAKKAKHQVEKEQQRAAHSSRRDLSRKPEDRDRYRAHYFKERATKTAGRKGKLAKNKKAKVSKTLEEARLSRKPTISPSIRESESHKGKVLLSATHAAFGYNDGKIVEDVNLTIHFGDKMALFGNNGVGKTTVIKGVLGLGEVEVEGDVQTPQNINIQYLDQEYALVDRNLSILDNLRNVATSMPLSDIRQHLARFLFMETPDVHKKASVLSGGEVARLSLAMLSVMPIDLLILDEPTNNLDIETIEEIELVLGKFSGAILVISHDLSFLRRIGVKQSYVISKGKFKKMMRNPEDGELLKQELLENI